MTTDLLTWLRDQLDRDERVAASARDDPYHQLGQYVVLSPDEQVADIAAKRALIGLAESAANRAGRAEEPVDEYTRTTRSMARMEAAALRESVCLLASAYAHRPGYREQWRP